MNRPILFGYSIEELRVATNAKYPIVKLTTAQSGINAKSGIMTRAEKNIISINSTYDKFGFNDKLNITFKYFDIN